MTASTESGVTPDATATLTELVLYPVKGCRGISVRSATLTGTGLEIDGIGDREWVVVDAQGRFLSQRQLPRMTLIETRLTGDALRLTAPGMLQLEVPFASEGDVVEVSIWRDQVGGVTQGEIADAWFTKFLGTPARLLRFDPQARRIANLDYTGGTPVVYKFADAFPLLICNKASLDDLNAHLYAAERPEVTMARFRPNLVVGGLSAFEEDHAEIFRIGTTQLRVAKPCGRCTVPGVDPATGVASTELLDLLTRTRTIDDEVIFGVNAIVAEGGAETDGVTLRVGQTADVFLRL